MSVNWQAALDLDRAVANLQVEQYDDWHQDPWGWPELTYVLTKEPSLIASLCGGSGSRQVALITVPKENWGSRPAVVLDILDRLMYQALVDRLSVDIGSEMLPSVFGWRLPAANPARGKYSRNSLQWDRYRSHLASLSSWHQAALKTDLVSFFASIPTEPAQEAIQDKTPKGAMADRLCDFIGSYATTSGRTGLPQRSWASAVLANMYLGPIDDLLLHHARPMPIPLQSKVQYHSFARWMDDIWLFGDSASAMRRAQVELQTVAESIGLNLNAAKTTVLEGADVEADAKSIEHSAVDDAIENRKDFAPLEALVDKILDDPEKAGRTSVRFAARRMREHGSAYRLQDISQAAERMPHTADAWSRLFREKFVQASLEDWFMDYVKSDWATHEWSIAWFARMFRSARTPGSSVTDYFGERIRDANTSLPLLAVAAQRLSVWDPPAARTACHDAIGRAANPHARRILALAALVAGERRTIIRGWLSGDAENHATLRMLEEASFIPPKVTRDFTG